MVELTVLGSANLVSGDGGMLEPVLRQPKRLALVTFLVLQPEPGGFVRRDRLLGTFWPEIPTDRGRAALRQALYFLSAQMGPDVFRRRGTEEVAIRPKALACDVWAFRAAARDGRLEDALDLYSGPLLDGFFLAGLHDFDLWLSNQRRELEECAGAAAWGLCARSASRGDLVHTRTWAHRAVELVGLDEGCAAWLMQEFVQHGDRVDALRVYRTLEEYLRNEFGIAPSEPLHELADRIRGASLGAGPFRRGGDRRSGRDRRAAAARWVAAERRSGFDRRGWGF